MRRIIILDISGMYAQIYDEIYCKENDEEKFFEIKNKYSSNQNYIIISILF